MITPLLLDPEPLLLVAAGLPILAGLAGESKSYAERLFSFPEVRELSREDSYKAIQEPVMTNGVSFEVEALEEIYHMTRGYPYLMSLCAGLCRCLCEPFPIYRDLGSS